MWLDRGLDLELNRELDRELTFFKILWVTFLLGWFGCRGRLGPYFVWGFDWELG